jgi:hypothetical protein
MGAPREVVLPSGAAGLVRGFKVREANMLADAAAMRAGTAYTRVLRECWVQTNAPGPYSDGPLDWDKALVCDRFVALMQVRIATYGSEYSFQVQCSAEACRKKFQWDTDLVKDFPVKPVPAESLDVFAHGGNRFPITIAGRAAFFRLLVGADEAKNKTGASAARSRLMTVALDARIVEVQGVREHEKQRWISDLDMGEVQEILATLDEADGGVDTDIDVECAECGNVFEVQLPFGRDFFVPSKKRSRAETL